MNKITPGFDLTVVVQPIAKLLPYPHNARTHSLTQIRQIAASMRVFGFTNPPLVTADGTIIAGHGRVEAAKLLGMTEIPTIPLENLTERQIQAYVLADNRLAERAGWDRQILSIELQNIVMSDCDFDVSVTGFDVGEIDLMVEEIRDKSHDQDDEFEIDVSARPVTRSGDIWQLAKHRVFCGNSLEESSFKILLGRRQANIVITDPPYNVAIDGHASGNGRIHHREFAMGSGELSEAEFVAFLHTGLRLLSRYSTSNSVHYLFMDWRHAGDLLAVGKQVYESFLNICVWVKNNGGMGSFYRSRHEFVFVFGNGKGRHQNNIQLGKFGRNRANVWEYASASTFSRQGEEGNLLALHPTVKPVAMIADALLDASARGDLALDSFLGSGTTLLAAERVGRICYGIEIDPLYVDVAIRRWQKHTGDHAIHAATGKRFDDVAAVSEVRDAN